MVSRVLAVDLLRVVVANLRDKMCDESGSSTGSASANYRFGWNAALRQACVDIDQAIATIMVGGAR